MAVMEAERIKLCAATTKNGNACRGIANSDGFCMVHSPARKFKPAEIGAKGGQRSANVRRARRKSDAVDARSLLRENYETLAAWREAVNEAYWSGLTATDAKGNPSAAARVAAADAFLAQCYGRPQQNIQTKHELNITVVSRTMEALDAVVELPAGDVVELPPEAA